ncbi:MAG: hypothetical protein GY788_07580 [bacterium]|nr:hypothetical protein [bacterium]
MLASITLVIPPAVEPVTLTEVKDHCRISDADSDVYLVSLIQAAREHVENRTSRALITQTLDIKYDWFGRWIDMPRAPLQSVTGVTYLDMAGTEQALDADVYRSVTDRDPGAIVLDYGKTWPDIYPVPSAVTVRIVSGYGDAADDVPQTIRQAMLLLIGHWFENREATVGGFNVRDIPIGVDALLESHRVRYF